VQKLQLGANTMLLKWITGEVRDLPAYMLDAIKLLHKHTRAGKGK